MKKLFLVALILLSSNLCYAQARNASVATISHEGRSNFANLGVTGLDVAGNPGYVALAQANPNVNSQTDFYLWVSSAGNLCMASYATLVTYSSFPTGDWSTGISCPKVGSQ